MSYYTFLQEAEDNQYEDSQDMSDIEQLMANITINRDSGEDKDNDNNIL